MLHDFIQAHREALLAQARVRVAARNAPVATEIELTEGLPAFLDQLGEALRKSVAHEVIDHDELKESAGRHGDVLYQRGLTVAQVVHDYGDLCQVITGLGVELNAVIETSEFQTLNLCLDDAIAGAVTAYERRRERAITDDGTERLGVLAHEMRNVLNSSMLSFSSIKRGIVAPGGSTSEMHERSLHKMQRLIDRSLADVRLDAGMANVERVVVSEIIEEVEVGAALVAQGSGLYLSVTTVDPSVIVEADRQILAAAISNLVQNALKFTHPGTTVRLRASATTTRVLIDIEDECGGLDPDKAPESLLKPFVQRSSDRSGLGLGLSIVSKAVKSMAGELHIQNKPGQGCVFTIDLPKQPPPPISIHSRKRTASDGPRGGSGKLGGGSARAF
jgi:signal transduction histidine kinase